MSNVGLTCPHCHERFELNYAEPAEPTGRGDRAKNGQITPLSSRALEDIFETFQRTGAGVRATTEELYTAYESVAADHVRQRTLTKYAFVLGLRRYGAQPWRSKYQRGYVTPEPLPAEPLSIAGKAKERRDAETYRSTVRGAGRPPAETDPFGVVPLP